MLTRLWDVIHINIHENSRGPRIEPCGTPVNITWQCFFMLLSHHLNEWKKYLTPLLTHWNCVFLASTHRFGWSVLTHCRSWYWYLDGESWGQSIILPDSYLRDLLWIEEQDSNPYNLGAGVSWAHNWLKVIGDDNEHAVWERLPGPISKTWCAGLSITLKTVAMPVMFSIVDNGLAPIRRQTIIRTNDGYFPDADMCHPASKGQIHSSWAISL